MRVVWKPQVKMGVHDVDGGNIIVPCVDRLAHPPIEESDG